MDIDLLNSSAAAIKLNLQQDRDWLKNTILE